MRILCLSGGGVQGLYTAGVLARLSGPDPELIAGTSIGAALATARAFAFDMEELEARFTAGAPSVFPSLGVSSVQMEKVFAAARGVVTARYKERPWRALLEDFFGEKTLADTTIPVVIPAIEFENGRLRLFTSWDKEPVKAVDAILASSAAPTFFPIQELGGEWLLDGGQAANAPDMVALTQAQVVMGCRLDTISMLSIGTASANPGLTREKTRDWGLAYWGTRERMLRLSMAVSQNTHTQMVEQLLGDRYSRLDAIPDPEQARHLALDGATPSAIRVLRMLGARQEIVYPKGW